MVTLTTDQIEQKPNEFIRQLETGSEIAILRDSHLIARVIPNLSAPGRPVYGSSAGKIIMADDFDKPLPDFDNYV